MRSTFTQKVGLVFTYTKYKCVTNVIEFDVKDESDVKETNFCTLTPLRRNQNFGSPQ